VEQDNDFLFIIHHADMPLRGFPYRYPAADAVAALVFLNSAIIFIVMFFTFPLAKKNYDMARITTGGSFADTAMSIFVKYNSVILVGFGTGTATGIMYAWGVYKAINFLWFLINLILLTIFIGMVIRDIDAQ